MRYERLEHGGYIARFTVELVYDRSADGRHDDFVGTVARCELCGVEIRARHPINLALESHAATHQPGPVS